MKKLEKEAVLKDRVILVSAVSFFIFILPYIFHLAINGIQPVKVQDFGNSPQTIQVYIDGNKEEIQLETYLVGALARHGDANFEDEALKAIAVILRSNAVRTIIEGGAVSADSFYTDEELRILWQNDYEMNLQRYRELIVTTEGIVVFYNGDIVKVPFHRLSAGETRDGDVPGKPAEYIKSVSSAEDMYADGYYATMEIKKSILGEDFDVLDTDRFGYALSVKTKGQIINGEQFRCMFNIPSACFDYEIKGDTYVFYVRGIGHGYGVSLYGANALAQKGWGFAEILEYYLPGIEIRKENRSDVIAHR